MSVSVFFHNDEPLLNNQSPFYHTAAITRKKHRLLMGGLNLYSDIVSDQDKIKSTTFGATIINISIHR